MKRFHTARINGPENEGLLYASLDNLGWVRIHCGSSVWAQLHDPRRQHMTLTNALRRAGAVFSVAYDDVQSLRADR